MAILAPHLNRSIGSAQGRLQVSMVIEVDGAWVKLAMTHRVKLWMLPVETRYMGVELWMSFFRVQIGVALGTSGICSFGHPMLSLVFKMT